MKKQRFQDHRESKLLLINEAHLPVVKDYTWLGMNVYTVTDLNLLIEWWNSLLKIAETREDKALIQFSSALWIRVNELHPKVTLRFEDITRPELLKKAA